MISCLATDSGIPATKLKPAKLIINSKADNVYIAGYSSIKCKTWITICVHCSLKLHAYNTSVFTVEALFLVMTRYIHRFQVYMSGVHLYELQILFELEIRRPAIGGDFLSDFTDVF